MPAAYDNYDYPAYWENREYEHRAEVLAITKFLKNIKKIKNVIEIGAGYGRLVSSYDYRSEKVFITDPSGKLLKIARNAYKYKKYKIIHSSLNNLNKKVKNNNFDLVVMVRVLHHIDNFDTALKTIKNLLAPGGYLILEFANKKHFKEICREFIRGNLTYPYEIHPKDKRSKKNIKKGTLPFLNFNPDFVREKLNHFGFEIIQKLSVSNIRSVFLKKHLSLDQLLFFEDKMQKPMSFINFGPSIFLLARKTS